MIGPPWRCRGCRRHLGGASPQYCSTTCLAQSAARRRAAGAARARRRRASTETAAS